MKASALIAVLLLFSVECSNSAKAARSTGEFPAAATESLMMVASLASAQTEAERRAAFRPIRSDCGSCHQEIFPLEEFRCGLCAFADDRRNFRETKSLYIDKTSTYVLERSAGEVKRIYVHSVKHLPNRYLLPADPKGFNPHKVLDD